MQKPIFLLICVMCVALTVLTFGATATAQAPAGTIKIGLILPMTGPSASTGRQIEAAVKLYVKQHGDKVAGKSLQLLIKDDGGIPETTRRLAQELLVNEKVAVIAGFGLTPLALATAPLATQSKTPMVVMAAATSSITEASPFIVRTSFTLPQVTVGIADWAAANQIKRVVTLVADYGPGTDAEKFFGERFQRQGGQVLEKLRTPLKGPDFAPVLQKVRDAKPEALFVFVPSGQGAGFMKQFVDRGLGKAGIRLIATGDVTDDDQLNDMGDAALGVVSSHHYSAAHPSELNKQFVAAFGAANNNLRPNFMAVGGYDGMHVIVKALETTKGAGGEALLNAMKGQAFESPRGPIQIDPQTRDITQDVYIRRVERVNGQLYNVEQSTMKAVKDPGKTK